MFDDEDFPALRTVLVTVAAVAGLLVLMWALWFRGAAFSDLELDTIPALPQVEVVPGEAA